MHPVKSGLHITLICDIFIKIKFLCAFAILYHMPMCVVHLRLRRMLILDFCGQTHKQKDKN